MCEAVLAFCGVLIAQTSEVVPYRVDTPRISDAYTSENRNMSTFDRLF